MGGISDFLTRCHDLSRGKGRGKGLMKKNRSAHGGGDVWEEGGGGGGGREKRECD